MTGSVRRHEALGRLAEAGLLTPAAVADAARTLAETGLNLAALARFAAHRFGDATALIDPEVALTFTQLADGADRLADRLRREHGLRRGTRVGVLCRNGAAFVLATLAASRLACRVMLLNPDMGAAQLRTLVEGREIGVVLCQADTVALLEGTATVAIAVGTRSEAAEANPPAAPRANGGELVILTGGTTGPPKAAARKPAPGNFLLLFAHLVSALGLDRHERCWIAVPMCHGYGVAAFLVALALGRTVYLTPRFDAAAGAALIAREDVQVLAVVPLMLQRLLHLPGADLSAVRCVITGGAALPPTLAEEAGARLGDDVLFNLYGTSEAGVSLMATPQDLAERPDTVGRPLWGVGVEIQGGDEAPVAPGEIGRLVIRSPAAMAGKRLVDTGDLASRAPDGRLTLHGRADDMISSGGEKVHPWEVETAILRHPEVREAACVGVPDPVWGQRLLAFVTPAPGASVTPESLFEWLEGRVARYQRPRALEFRDALPVTPVGKLDRRALLRSLPPEVSGLEAPVERRVQT